MYEETIDHVKAEHSAQFPVELPSMINAVSGTLKEPTRTSDSYNNSVEYINDNTINRKGHPLRVYVQKISGTTSGYMTTFFFGTVQDDDDE